MRRPVAPDSFTFIHGDMRDLSTCRNACVGAQYVLHEAPLGSVTRTLADDPIPTDATNLSGFLNMLPGPQAPDVSRISYAASSSTYGDHSGLPKVGEQLGCRLSPYVVTKYGDELTEVSTRRYGFGSIGLRYFNLFPSRQDPDGVYAVVPEWAAAMIQGADVLIDCDGEPSGDFCYVDTVVQANLLGVADAIRGDEAGESANRSPLNQVFIVTVDDRTTLNQLFGALPKALEDKGTYYDRAAVCRACAGDARHPRASVSKAMRLLDYSPHSRPLPTHSRSNTVIHPPSKTQVSRVLQGCVMQSHEYGIRAGLTEGSPP